MKPVIIIVMAFVLVMGTIIPVMAEEILSSCGNIEMPQIDPKMQGDAGLNNPQYMEAYREAQNQYQQQMQKCIRDNQEVIDQRVAELQCGDFEFVDYTAIKDYDLLYDLISNGLNERNQDAGKIVVDNYKDTQQYELECNFLWKEFSQIRTESENWHNSCGDSDYPNSIQLQNMYNTMNGVCRFATLVPVEQSINESDNICGKGTVFKNGQCVPDTKSSKGGGCLIATATYGSELAPQVQQLRELRDNQLLNTELGTSFIGTFNDVYYSFSPVIADYERENPIFKEMIKVAITPMISSLSILNYVDMDSESEVIGYGISLIVLNLAMYFGIPASVIMRIRK